MISLFTESYFREAARDISETYIKTFSNNLSSYTDFDIFLSYNIADKTVVKGIFEVLSKMGFRVYLDFVIDPQLNRANVTKQTALVIQNRLKHSQSLIYAASINAAMSRWMPWELGYVDGHKQKCAILPVGSNPQVTYKSSEYLLLYPYISNINGKMHIRNSDLDIGEALQYWIKPSRSAL